MTIIDTYIPMELSKTEYRVAEYISRGMLEKEIADKMCISPATVHNHAYRIRKKWGARNAVDIARKFILSLEDPKNFFMALLLCGVQVTTTLTSPDIDLRQPVRVSVRTSVRTVRTK